MKTSNMLDSLFVYLQLCFLRASSLTVTAVDAKLKLLDESCIICKLNLHMHMHLCLLIFIWLIVYLMLVFSHRMVLGGHLLIFKGIHDCDGDFKILRRQ